MSQVAVHQRLAYAHLTLRSAGRLSQCRQGMELSGHAMHSIKCLALANAQGSGV